MSTEESLSVAVRGHLSGAGAISSVELFSGTGFMLNGDPGRRRVQTRPAPSSRQGSLP